MSRDDQGLVVRSSRRALNNLQYSPNGKDVVGLSPRKPRSTNNRKLDLSEFETSICSPSLSKNRTSLSLPEISSKSISTRSMKPSTSTAIFSSAMAAVTTSTPHHQTLRNNKSGSSSKQNASSPIKCTQSAVVSKKNISVILEEKENPNNMAAAAAKKQQQKKHLDVIPTSSTSTSAASSTAARSARLRAHRMKHSSVQCNLIDELIVTADDVDQTPYWKMMAHKRMAAIDEAQQETKKINREMTKLNEKNDTLREKIANYLKYLKEYDEIKNTILESIDDCDDDEEESNVKE